MSATRTLKPDRVAVAPPVPTRTDTPKVLHQYPCWVSAGRFPVPGDRAYCGAVKRGPVTEGVPLEGHEHLSCVVCADLRMWSSWS